MKNIKDKHIVVAGAARSGAAAATLLAGRGAEVFVTERDRIGSDFRGRLRDAGIPFEEGGHTGRARKGDFLVVSPGMPSSAPLVRSYLEAGKAVYSELEAASWFCRSPMVAVTGSNGKTTVANWLDHTWRTAGRDPVLAGNIGPAFSDHVDRTSPDREAILEVSSFQLDHIDTFCPYISLLLNVTPDHLDRYDNDFERYAASKRRITENQGEGDCFIYGADDPTASAHADTFKKKAGSPRLLAFSRKREVRSGAFLRDQQIILNIDDNEEVLMPIDEVGLRGKHNLNNGLATALAARAAEIKNDVIRESLRTFEGVEHRLEEVRSHDGVRYINDSKATNINAVWYALDSFNVPMVLILGGRDKGNDYGELAQQIREKVHTVVAIGEARPLIEEQLKGVVPQLMTAADMAEAVRLSRANAKRGEIVLLSPACASFDMFENYEHRGNEFKKAVNNL
ncbi:MAG: UDP-N-acetylmuramoyl-L-alanine--D-glutamate ligase [Balneolaceae bacterium]|nr:UDP-N-acetylmuramoyl-L-alanine--D-glutamate ligase [Balneolaceae bacterium]